MGKASVPDTTKHWLGRVEVALSTLASRRSFQSLSLSTKFGQDWTHRFDTPFSHLTSVPHGQSLPLPPPCLMHDPGAIASNGLCSSHTSACHHRKTQAHPSVVLASPASTHQPCSTETELHLLCRNEGSRCIGEAEGHHHAQSRKPFWEYWPRR